MGRLILVIILMGVSGVIYLAKAGARKVTGGKEVNFQQESQKVMEKTARGVEWMNAQWDQAKSQAKGVDQRSSKASRFDNETASTIITEIRKNPNEYDNAEAEAIFVEQALKKVQSNRPEEAKQLAYQVLDDDSREYLLSKIASV
jgi:hypothetical protein